jgi:ribokinase
MGTSLQEFGGGKGANQAVAAKRAGAKVHFVGAIGDDFFGLARRAELEFERIDISHLSVFHAVASGVALIMVNDQGENLIGVAPGANAKLAPEHIERIPADWLSKGNIFVTPWETPTETIRAGLSRAKSFGATTIFNPAPVGMIDPADDWLSFVDILILNEHELATITGHETASAVEAIPMIRSLHARGVHHVIVTLGSEGHLLSTEGNVEAQHAFLVEPIDTVAAGDTFVGALASRLAERASLRDAARWASAAAAISVTRAGAQSSIPNRAEIDLFLARLSRQ